MVTHRRLNDEWHTEVTDSYIAERVTTLNDEYADRYTDGTVVISAYVTGNVVERTELLEHVRWYTLAGLHPIGGKWEIVHISIELESSYV